MATPVLSTKLISYKLSKKQACQGYDERLAGVRLTNADAHRSRNRTARIRAEEETPTQ
jgi:hypothetical protein